MKKWGDLTVAAVAELLKVAPKIAKKVLKTFSKLAIVYKTKPAEYHGRKGNLVWDFLVYHELYFVDSKTGECITLYESFDDDKTKARWKKLRKKYGR